MPCYQVQIVTVVFNAENRELLIEALNALGIRHSVNGDIITANGMRFNLKSQTVDFQYGDERTINRIKQEYSLKAVEAAAKKNRWILKKKAGQERQWQAIKY